MHNYFHSLVGGATFDPAIGQPDPLGTMLASLATSIDPVFFASFPIWIDSGLNGSQMGTQVAIIILPQVDIMEISTTVVAWDGGESPGNQGSGDVDPYYPFCHQMILSQLQTLWISGSTAAHMTRLVIRFCEAASIKVYWVRVSVLFGSCCAAERKLCNISQVN